MYRSASVFVMPSRFERFGIVSVEALSYQLPVVAGDCCGIREIIQEGHIQIGVAKETLSVYNQVIGRAGITYRARANPVGEVR